MVIPRIEALGRVGIQNTQIFSYLRSNWRLGSSRYVLDIMETIAANHHIFEHWPQNDKLMYILIISLSHSIYTYIPKQYVGEITVFSLYLSANLKKKRWKFNS